MRPEWWTRCERLVYIGSGVFFSEVLEINMVRSSCLFVSEDSGELSKPPYRCFS